MRNAATITAISAKIAAAISRATGTEVPVITAEEIAAFRPGTNPAADTPLAAYILALTPEAIRQLGTDHPFRNEDIREVIVNLTQYAKFSMVEPGWHRPAHDEADLASEEIAARREDEYLNRIPREYWPDAPDGTPRTDADMEAAEVKIEAEAKLTAWAAVREQRNDLVRAALAAGVTKSRIQELTGISRSTIDRIPGIAQIAPATQEPAVDVLTYAPTNAGTRTVTGTWQAWRAQFPALPEEPTTEPVDPPATDDINVANERYQGKQITVTGPDGTEHVETLSLLWYPKFKDGQMICRAYILTAPEPTRQGRCQVCSQYGELVERADASGITGWVCRTHDDLDIVFA